MRRRFLTGAFAGLLVSAWAPANATATTTSSANATTNPTPTATATTNPSATATTNPTSNPIAAPVPTPNAAPNAPLTLTDLKRLAREKDPRTAQARAQVESAASRRDEAVWAFFPKFETTFAVAGPTPEARLAGGDAGQLEDLTPGTRSGWGQLGAAFRFETQAILPLYTFGKYSAGRAAAGHGVAATEALLLRARDQAAFDVTRAYWGYQTSRNAGTSIENIRKKLREAQDQAKKLLGEGSDQLSKSDALKLEYLAEEIEARHAETVKNAALSLTSIRLLIGARPEEQFEISRQDLPEPPPAPDAEALLAHALQNRPEARAAAQAVAARQQLVELERARLYPDLALVGGTRLAYTTNASRPVTPFAFDPYNERVAFVALAVRGTFDIPQKIARIRQVEADLHEALAQQRGAESLVRLELSQALGELQEARTRVDRFTRETAIGKQLATQASLAFDSGLGEARELIEDTLLFARADGERFKALFDAQIAWAALEKAVGGF